MSSRSAEKGEGDRDLPVSSWSITAKLVILYTLSLLLILVASSVFLYWSFVHNLAREDNQFLADKVALFCLILQKHSAPFNELDEEINWERRAYQATPYYARILDEEGRFLVETHHMSEIIAPHLFPPPYPAMDQLGEGAKWKSPEGESYLLIAAWAACGETPAKGVLIQVALDISSEQRLIVQYRRGLFLVLILGTLFAASLGIVLTHKGLQPLQEITRTVQRITPSHLHERIGQTRWPGELTVLAGAFDGMLERLEHSFTRLSQLSSDLAHELRTPINNLMGETEVALTRDRTAEEYRLVLESSLEEFHRLARMIDSMLFLARAENAEIQIEKTRFAARREAEHILEYYSVMAEEKGIELSCDGDAVLEADPVLFRQAVGNLVANALRHTPAGGRVCVSIRQLASREVEVGVTDNGVGIEAEHLPHIFERFYQADRSRSAPREGTGLGLTIVKSILELQGGRVYASSEPESGTTVTLRFPSLA